MMVLIFGYHDSILLIALQPFDFSQPLRLSQFLFALNQLSSIHSHEFTYYLPSAAVPVKQATLSGISLGCCPVRDPVPDNPPVAHPAVQ